MSSLNSTRPERGRGLLVGLFALDLVLLAWIVLWKLAVPWEGEAALLPHPLKLLPFLADGTADASSPLEVVANILLFVPFGVYLRVLAPGWQWWKAAGIFAASSLLLESTQLLLSTGSFDTTDVITNTAGGLVGFGIYSIARRRFGDGMPALATRLLLIGTAISLIAVAAFIASPLRYEPQHDVIFPSPAAE